MTLDLKELKRHSVAASFDLRVVPVNPGDLLDLITRLEAAEARVVGLKIKSGEGLRSLDEIDSSGVASGYQFHIDRVRLALEYASGEAIRWTHSPVEPINPDALAWEEE